MSSLIDLGRDVALRRPIDNSDSSRRRAKLFNLKTARVSYLEFRHTVRGRSYRYFALFYFDNGRRIRETRSTFASAKARAEQIDRHVQNGELNMLSLKEADRSCYLQACENISKTGKSLLAITESYADLHRRLPSNWTIERVFEIGLVNLPTNFTPKNIPDLVHDFLADRKGQISTRWYRTLEQQLDLFAGNFTGPLHETNSASLNAWLRGLDVGAYTRKHYRAALSQLVTWSKDNHHLPRTWSEMNSVAKPEPKPVQTKILAPDQFRSMLEYRQAQESKDGTKTKDSLIPFLVLAGFCGIRHEEMNGEKSLLDWSNIDLKDKTVYVPKDVSKVGNDRIVPISDNAQAWLRSYERSSGPITSLQNTSNALSRLKHAVGIPAGKNETRNTLRKSFISYRLAILKNIAQVAEEAGNSPAKIRSNYLRLPKEPIAHAWFNIYPRQAQLRLRGL